MDSHFYDFPSKSEEIELFANSFSFDFSFLEKEVNSESLSSFS